MITQNIKVDVNLDHRMDPIICRIGEQNSRVIRFECVNYVDDIEEAVIFSTDNPTAQLRIVKPDNTFVIVNAGRAEPTDRVLFDVILPAEAAQVSGFGYYDFRIYDSALEEPGPTDFLYTASGRFIVDDDMLTDEMIESVASVNGLVFPDDFLTSTDLDDYVKEEELDDYATKTYVDDAIAAIPSPLHNYSESETIVGTWIDGSTVYERTYYFDTLAWPSDWTAFDSTTPISKLLYSEAICTLQNDQQGGINIRIAFNSVNNRDKLSYYYDGYSQAIKNVCITVRYTKS